MAKVQGKDYQVTTCDHCGRMNLKYTVILDFGNKIEFWGKDCTFTETGKRV